MMMERVVSFCGGGRRFVLGGGSFRVFSSTSGQHHPPATIKSWGKPPTRPSPCLMINSDVEDVLYKSSQGQGHSNKEDADDYHHLFNLLGENEDDKIFRVKKHLKQPWMKELLTPDKAHYFGSCNGWLGFIHPRTSYPYLFNPFIFSPSNFPYIPLPPLETLPSQKDGHFDFPYTVRLLKSDFSSKFPLTRDFLKNSFADHGESTKRFYRSIDFQRLALSTPSPDQDFIAMANYGKKPVFCDLGRPDPRWTVLDTGNRCESFLFRKKDACFYALCQDYSLQIWGLKDLSSQKSSLIFPRLSPQLAEYGYRYNWPESELYLVESGEDLLLLERLFKEEEDQNDKDEMIYTTKGFNVFKLNAEKNEWEYLESLGDRALFVGSNHPFSLSTLEFPEMKANCIYFTSSIGKRWPAWLFTDNGVFHLEDRSVTPIYPNDLHNFEPQSIWIEPPHAI